jgi:hypothetical protein
LKLDSSVGVHRDAAPLEQDLNEPSPVLPRPLADTLPKACHRSLHVLKLGGAELIGLQTLPRGVEPRLRRLALSGDLTKEPRPDRFAGGALRDEPRGVHLTLVEGGKFALDGRHLPSQRLPRRFALRHPDHIGKKPRVIKPRLKALDDRAIHVIHPVVGVAHGVTCRAVVVEERPGTTTPLRVERVAADGAHRQLPHQREHLGPRPRQRVVGGELGKRGSVGTLVYDLWNLEGALVGGVAAEGRWAPQQARHVDVGPLLPVRRGQALGPQRLGDLHQRASG